jgi:hypothetical protein
MLLARHERSQEEMEKNRIAFYRRFEMKNNSYELWFYDVWGNEEDGFEVNDRHCASRDFVIPTMPKTYNKGTPRQFTDFVPSDKEILTVLVSAGELKESALYANITIDGDDETIYLTEDNGCPLCELFLNKVEVKK